MIRSRARKYGKIVHIKKTLLIDGNALFKRGFIGAKDLFNKKNEHIGGLYQFITILRKLLKEDLYDKAFVFWDGEYSGKLRYDFYKDYKINRNKDYENGTSPVDLQEKKEKFLVSQYLEELYIRQHIDNSKVGVEADDLIAYYCKTKEENEKIVICTSDRDLCQLINNNITIYLCDLKQYINLNNYNTIFKHHQSNSKLIKIIAGDNSDSIKGIKGVKETSLLKYFPVLKERKVLLNEIIELAKKIQNDRLKIKKPKLIALENIINSNTNGIQGKNIYEINKKLIDLDNPLIDYRTIKIMDTLKLPILDIDKRGIKNVYKYMKRDGFSDLIYGFSTEYLLPFKELIERENKNNLNINNND